MRRCRWLGLFLLLAGSGAGHALAADEEPVRVALAADQRSFTVEAPGLAEFRAGFAATIQRGGQTQTLSAAGGAPAGAANSVSEETPYGTAEVTASTFHFGTEHIDLLFRLGRVPGVAGVLAQAGVRNTGREPVNLFSVTPLGAEFRVSGNSADWLVTRLDTSVDKLPPVTALGEIREPHDVFEYGGFYRYDGTGFLFGPVGAPVAYVNARIGSGGDGKVSFDFTAEMSGARVDPGETRWGQQVILLLEPPRPAMTRWAEWVAKTHGARTDKGALPGWNTCQLLERKTPGEDVRGVVDAVVKSAGRLVPAVIQLDADFRDAAARLADDNRPPGELADYVRRIAATGARSGLRLEFSRELFGGNPPAMADIAKLVRNAVQNGFTYLKIFYPSAADLNDGKQTRFEAVRAACRNLRQAAGEDTYLMWCAAEPDRAIIGLLDSSGVTKSPDRQKVRPVITDALRSFQLNDRWFAVVDEQYYIGTEIGNISEVAGGWPLARTWMSMVGLSCGAAITSDPLQWESFRPYWRNVEVLTPPARERTDVLDMGTGREWPRLVGHVQREWGGSTVALLWNPGTTERTVRFDFATAGMDPHRRYAVWSFWDDQYLGVVEGSWTTPRLGPSASQHLRFTELEQEPSKPVLIGSNLHIYCGAAEIKHVTSLQSGMEIELTDAGARDGDLFIYSRLPPVLKTAAGCTVSGITSAGEYVWRIALLGRQRGVPQRIEVGVHLPVTRQPWFWGLIVLTMASALLAAWRYLAWLRLQRVHALERERARIAQDLHDDLGAELSSIAMLSDLARYEAGDNPAVRSRLDEIGGQAQRTVRRLEEIVWAVNPANDTLERFVGFFCKFAQSYLELTGVASRFDIPDRLPDVPLSSVRRHNLFLAAKEALHNAVRHGAPTQVVIRVVLHDGRLTVTVEDNGCGFTDTPVLLAGHGSDNMRQRMKRIGGDFERRTAPGHGTVVVLSLPVPGDFP